MTLVCANVAVHEPPVTLQPTLQSGPGRTSLDHREECFVVVAISVLADNSDPKVLITSRITKMVRSSSCECLALPALIFRASRQSLSSAAFKRLSKELTTLHNSPPEGIRVQLDESNILNVNGWIEGPCRLVSSPDFLAVRADVGLFVLPHWQLEHLMQVCHARTDSCFRS